MRMCSGSSSSSRERVRTRSAFRWLLCQSWMRVARCTARGEPRDSSIHRWRRFAFVSLLITLLLCNCSGSLGSHVRMEMRDSSFSLPVFSQGIKQKQCERERQVSFAVREEKRETLCSSRQSRESKKWLRKDGTGTRGLSHALLLLFTRSHFAGKGNRDE